MTAILLSSAALALSAQAATAQTVLKSEPAIGKLGPGQEVWVQCGPGKARKVTGGGMGSGPASKMSGGAPRQRGPCVAMKS